MAEVEVNGHRFMIGKMPVFDQAHVARKVAPVISGMGRGWAEALRKVPDALTNGQEISQAQQNELIFEALGPVTEILAQMPEEDVNYVLKKCLGVGSIHTGQSFAPLVRGGNLMFEQETDLGTMLQLVMEVVKDNIGPTLRGLIPLFGGGEPAPPLNLPQ